MSSSKKRIRIPADLYEIFVHFSDSCNSVDGLIKSYTTEYITHLVVPDAETTQKNKILNMNNKTTTAITFCNHVNTIVLAPLLKEINVMYVAGFNGYLHRLQSHDTTPLSRFKDHVIEGVLNIFVFNRRIDSTFYVMTTEVVKNFVAVVRPDFGIVPTVDNGHSMYFVQSTPGTALQAEVTFFSHFLFTFPNTTDPFIFNGCILG
jgi:hypothetical protein